MGLLSTGCLLLICAGTARADSGLSVESKVDRVLDKFARPASPGCAVAVVEKAKQVLSKGYGQASLEHRLPIGPETRFHVASLSKQFTAWAVLTLADEGKLKLSDPVGKYLKDLPKVVAGVTLEQLLHHSSGVRDQWQLLILSGWRLADDLVRDEDVLSLVRRQRSLDFAAGTEFRYSNTGYTLLAHVVRAAAGKPFADFVAERLLVPQGMKRTSFRTDYRTVIPDRAFAYVADESGRMRLNEPHFSTAGATGLVTCATDMARWAAYLDSRPALVAQMERASPFGYAAGWFVSQSDGETVLQHSGSDAGYRAHFLRFPARQLTVVVLCNTDADARQLSWRIADALRDKPTSSARTEVPRLADAAPWKKYEGTFLHPTDGRVRRILIAGGKLRLDVDTVQYALSIEGATVFRNHNQGTTVCIRLENDHAQELVEEDSHGVKVVYQVRPAWQSSDLSAFEGEYTSEEIDNRFDVHKEGDRLVLRGRKDLYEVLEPTVTDGFNSGLGHFLFIRGEGRSVIGARLSGERVRGLQFTRKPASMKPADGGP